MVIKNVSLDIVCGITSRLPQTGKPEVAFTGRSNVGKSSLINSLMNRKALARISSSPGKTQTINFYQVNQTMYLVDLPGYGYAKTSRQEREKWGKMVERYLRSSKSLKAVFQLVDLRHPPTQNDKDMYRWILAQGFTPVVIGTKLDKLKKSQVVSCLKTVRQGLGMKPDQALIPFSAVTKQGREEIWTLIEGLTCTAAEDSRETSLPSQKEEIQTLSSTGKKAQAAVTLREGRISVNEAGI